MKDIKLIQYNLPNKTSVYTKHRQFSFWIGDRPFHFRSETKLKIRLAEINRDLTKILHELVWILRDIRIQYYDCWFLLDNQDNYSLTEIKQNFIGIEKKLELLTRNGLIRENLIIWRDFDYIFKVMDLILRDLIRLMTKKKKFDHVWAFRILKSRLESMYNSFNSLAE